MKKKEKGFTLVEIVISMSIVLIVLALSSALVVTISKISAQRGYDELCITEYENASKLVQEYKNAYSTNQYYIYQVDSNMIVIKKDDNEFKLIFNEAARTLSAQIYNYSTNQVDVKSLTFKNILKIQFSSEDYIIKCTYQFENFNQYANLLDFGVNQ